MDRHFLGIKPAGASWLYNSPEEAPTYMLEKKGQHGPGRGMNPWPPDNKYIALLSDF